MPQKEGYRISGGRRQFEVYWQRSRLFHPFMRRLAPHEMKEFKHMLHRAWINGRVYERRLQHSEAEKRRYDGLSGRVRRFWDRTLALLST